MAEKDFIWAYLIQLGMRMWGDAKRHPAYRDTLECDDAVWAKVTDAMAYAGMNMLVIDLGEGLVYPSHPELAVKGSWTPEKLQKEIVRLKANGIEAIPKLNFSAAHDGWLGERQYEISTPGYYRLVADLIRDVAEIFGRPRLFHIGMDEESDINLQKNRELLIVRQHGLWWHDVGFIMDEVRKAGCRPWMWGSDVWFNHDEFLKNVPRDAIVSNGYYGRTFDEAKADVRYTKVRMRTYAEFESAGFDQIPCGSNWVPAYYKDNHVRRNDVNFPLTVAHCRRVVSPAHLKGFLMAPWDKTIPKRLDYLLQAVDLVAQSMVI